MRTTKNYLSLILFLVVVACNNSGKQTKEETKQYIPSSPELFAEIAHLDSVMFDAFSAHDR